MILYKNKKLVIPTGINPNFHLDKGLINNQDKTVNISENGKTTVQHDEGFTGLGTVTINTYVGQVKVEPLYTTEYTENGEFRIIPDDGYDAIGEIDVTVNVQPELEAKIVDSSTNEQVVTTDKYGLSSVTVNPYTLDEKTVDSSTNPQIITSDEDGLKQVTINPYVLSPLEVDSSTASQEITGQFGTVTVNPYTLDSSSAVITENGDYAFESSADGLSRVDVTVNLDTQSYYNEGYSNGKTAGIAEGIAEQKAKLDSSTFTLNGTYTREDGWNSVTVNVDTVNNQNKTVDSSIATQIVTPDSGYTGIGQVTVNPYTLTAKTVNPSTSTQNVVPETGYNGLSKVTVNAVTAAIDSNIQAGNIKSGVSILGVTGTLVGDNYESYIENGTYVRNQTGKSNVYFDTRVTYPAPSNTNFLVEIKFSPIYSQNNSPQWVMGCSDGDDSDLAIGYYNDMLVKWFNANTANTTGFSPAVHIVKYTYNSRNTINAYLDGNIIGAFGSEAYEGVKPIYLFKANYATNPQPCYPGTRIYYVKIYANDNILHEFIPAYNHNQYCFYDKATGGYIYAIGGTATGHIY